uniref:SHSP domain-containing protein n=1 Tax=Steinernema glaseri TaxID=37863 RepID=A0A1I7YFA5_9BILA
MQHRSLFTPKNDLSANSLTPLQNPLAADEMLTVGRRSSRISRTKDSIATRQFMAPNFHDTLYNRYSTSSDGYESSASSGSNPFSYSDSVTEMDRQLARIRKAPSKIIDEKRRFIVLIDMSNFKPEDIEVLLEKGRLTVKAQQEVMIDSKTSVEKHFLRKFSIPNDVRDEFVATELDKFGMLKITLLRK